MTTLSDLQRLTDAEIVEKVAVEVMGWEKVIVDYHELKPKKGFVLGKDGQSYMTPSNAKWEDVIDSCEWNDHSVGDYWIDLKTKALVDESSGLWNPLTNWNHWRQVEERIMESEELSMRYTVKLGNLLPGHLQWKAELRTRCLAALLADG